MIAPVAHRARTGGKRRVRTHPVRENRIHEEAIADAGPEEQAMGWYSYLENKISFPFKAKCVVSTITSPLAKGEVVEVLRVPLSRLTAVEPDQATEEAIGDWQYWVAYGYQL